MPRKRVFEILDATPEARKDKIAMLKKAITEGSYKVKAEDIAEKILKERLFELALTLYNHKSKG
jgi:flagellar biosynthesis anti-sigma factor FlgM